MPNLLLLARWFQLHKTRNSLGGHGIQSQQLRELQTALRPIRGLLLIGEKMKPNLTTKALIAAAAILGLSFSPAQAQGIGLAEANQIKFSVYRDSRGKPYLEVAYKRRYEEAGEFIANREVKTVYTEEKALKAGYTQEQVDMILGVLDFIEASVYTANNLPRPTPTPTPTPTGTP